MDAVTVIAAMAVAVRLHIELREWLPAVREPPAFHEYATLVYLTLPLWLALIVVLRLNRTFERPWGHAELLVALIRHHGAALAGLALLQFLTQSVINRSLVALFMACTLLMMYAQRAIISAWARFQHRRGYGQPRVLLVGRPSRRMTTFVERMAERDLPPKLLGYLEPPQPADGLSAPPAGAIALSRLGALSDLSHVLHEQSVDHVLFFPPVNRPEQSPEALGACEEVGVSASFSVDLVRVSSAVPHLDHIFDHPFVTFDVAPKRPEALAIKHGIDPILAAILLAVLSPLMLLVALAVLVTMGRPVLFAQERAGLYGRPFRMLKFRTMESDAEQRRAEMQAINEIDGPVFKSQRDPRVTPMGRILRRASMDELPQLFNVLLGSMSLVGPRPLPLHEQAEIHGWQRRRLSMKPGITCLWQVSGRSRLGFEDWMLLDLEYVDGWSLGLDLWILLKTLPAVLRADGAH